MIGNILYVVLCALGASLMWAIPFYVILHLLCEARNKNIPDEFTDLFSYMIVTTFIIFLIGIPIIFRNDMPYNKNNNEAQKEEQSIKITNLEDENQSLNDKLDEAKSKLENLEEEYKYSEQLIDILKEQLEENGIEPNEL